MNVTAADETEASWNELFALLREFGVPDQSVQAVTTSRDAELVKEAAMWLKSIQPGLRSKEIMDTLAYFTDVRDHEHNIAYVNRQKCLPELPLSIVNRKKIKTFFMAAKDILDHGNPTCYMKIGKHASTPSK